MSGITRTRNLINHSLVLDGKNVLKASVQNNQKFLNFDVLYTSDGGNTDTLFFTLMTEEVRFLLDNPAFLPWFDDGIRVIRVERDGIYIIPSYCALGGQAQTETVRLLIRHVELFPLLRTALGIPKGASLEFAEELRRSQEMATPALETEWSAGALSVFVDNRALLTPLVEHVQNIARNASNGQDDPVTLAFYKDGDRSLYWAVRKTGRQLMNGGIIWHWHGDDQGYYALHT